MAIRVQAVLVFTEDEFEKLSFEEKSDIIETMLTHTDWKTELVGVAMDEVGMEDDWSIDTDED